MQLTKDAITVILKEPKLSNTTTADFGLTTNLSRQGTQHQHLAPRPNVVTRHYEFENIQERTLLDLKLFLIDNLGMAITVADHNGDSYQGVVNPEAIEVVTRHDACSYDLSLDILEIT